MICAFCHKSLDLVKQMFPSQYQIETLICNECVKLFSDVLKDFQPKGDPQ